MLVGSLLAGHKHTTVRPALGHTVPFTLSWHARSSSSAVVRRFINSSLRADLPEGWLAGRHAASHRQ
jgi:hypothetical protein